MDLSVCVASGEPFLGEFQVLEPGPVVYLAGEDRLSRMRGRYERLAVGMDLDPAKLPIHIIPPGQGLLLDEPGLLRDHLRDTIESCGARLLVVDPSIRFHRGNENSATDVARVLGWLRELIEETRCAVSIVRHDRKFVEGDESRRPGERSRGSSDWWAWADSMWSASPGLRRDGLLEVGLSIEAKDVGGVKRGTAVFEWRPGEIATSWRSGVGGDPVMAETKADILRVLAEAGGSVPSLSELEERVPRGRENVRQAVKELELEGEVRIEAGKRGAKRVGLVGSDT